MPRGIPARRPKSFPFGNSLGHQRRMTRKRGDGREAFPNIKSGNARGQQQAEWEYDQGDASKILKGAAKA